MSVVWAIITWLLGKTGRWAVTLGFLVAVGIGAYMAIKRYLPTPVEQVYGTTYKVSSGDQITVRLERGFRRTRDFRLWGLDAPPLSQPFGVEARDYLLLLAPKGEPVRVAVAKIDARYGTAFGPSGWEINKELVYYGLARAAGEDSPYWSEERSAKRSGRGMWER